MAIITKCYKWSVTLHKYRYELVIRLGGFRTLKTLDCTRYDGPVTSDPEVKRFQRMNLSNFQNLKLINKLKLKKSNNLRLKINKKKSAAVLIVATSVITQGNTYAIAADNSDHYKLYLHSKIVNYKQFKCAYEVAYRESRWNWRAVNGSHYGLFQMRNKKVQYMNPYTQIDWWLRYVSHRYKGTPCLSLAHLKSKGWQ